MVDEDVHEIDGVDDLYALEPAEFTAARNALVRALKADGRKDDAALVAALRKPPTTAWALNQVARTDPDLVDDALEAGAALRAATDAAMAGDPGALREATAADRAASGALVAAARERLAGAGGAGADTRLAATIRAAVLDDDVAADLRRGTLTADHDRSGLGLGAELDAWLAPAPAGRHLHAVPDPEAGSEDGRNDDAGGGRPRRRSTGGGAAASRRGEAERREPDDAPKGATLAERRAAEREAKEAARRQEEEQARQEAEDRAHRRLVNELRTAASRAEKRAARLEKVAVEAETEAADARSDADEAAAAAEEVHAALADAEAEAATRRGD